MSVPAAYLGVVIIWATTPLAIKWSAEEVGFLFGLTTRMALGALVAAALLGLLRARLPWTGEARRTYLASGLGLFLAMVPVYWASQFIPSGWISAVFGLAPVATGVMASYWLGERALTPPRLLGMGLGLAGLLLIFAGGSASGHMAVLGVAAMVLSVIAHCASAVAVKRIGADLSALATTTGGLLVALPLYTMATLLSGQALPSSVPLRAVLSILYLGIVGSVLGFALYYYVLRKVEATGVALITLVTPVLALLLGHAVNGEPIEPRVWSGTGVILGGLGFYHFDAWLGAYPVRGGRPRWHRAEGCDATVSTTGCADAAGQDLLSRAPGASQAPMSDQLPWLDDQAASTRRGKGG